MPWLPALTCSWRTALICPTPIPRTSEGRVTGICANSVCKAGRPIRIFYAFDPRRISILLIGGDKTGHDRFYEVYLPVADDLYDAHLEELRKEGLIE